MDGGDEIIRLRGDVGPEAKTGRHTYFALSEAESFSYISFVIQYI